MRHRRSAFVARIACVFLAVLGGQAGLFAAAPAAHAAASYQLLGEGLDSCVAPTAAQMANFWNGSPYYYWGIYIGGSERSCAQPNLTASWISKVTTGTVNGVSMSWKLLPLWVGPQAPCQPGFGDHISTNTTTAKTQGENEASNAYGAWTITLGQSPNTPIVYDMEYTGGTITSTCLAAMKAFISGWDYQMHLSPPQKAGIYTSSQYGDLASFASSSPAPDFIDGANYSSGKSTSSLPGVSSSLWVHQQRHKQYRGPHNETYNGTTINVDSRCANSWVYATYTVANTAQGCS